MPNTINVCLAQFAPVWLKKDETIKKAVQIIHDAAKEGGNLVIFGEAFLPGYPFWLSRTDGAKFNSPVQKQFYSWYAQNSISINAGDLQPFCAAARQHTIAIYLGCIERADNRGGHSLYCSLIYINQSGNICSVHRKLMPTYEERLVWAIGDGNGLQVHQLEGFTVGGLNCWENWMPLARTALTAQGENLHVAVWPGSANNTNDITRFIAKEARSFVVSVGTPLHSNDIPEGIPCREQLMKTFDGWIANGGSCVAGPDGKWILEPVTENETLLKVTLSLDKVFEERQNFDPVGHYSRPDVTQLTVNRQRQQIIYFSNDEQMHKNE